MTTRGAGRETPSRLRLVPPAPKSAGRSSASLDAACRSAFQLVLAGLLALTFFGLARVALSAKVTETSMNALKLEKTIKDETRVADQLELDKSMLVTPSRIESIAAGSLQMTKAPAPKYISVPGTIAVNAPAATGPAAPSAVTASETGASGAGSALSAVLGAALDVTEREARTLLVGDVGLAASR